HGTGARIDGLNQGIGPERNQGLEHRLLLDLEETGAIDVLKKAVTGNPVGVGSVARRRGTPHPGGSKHRGAHGYSREGGQLDFPTPECTVSGQVKGTGAGSGRMLGAARRGV